MAKDAYYFSHDANARHDPKMIEIRSLYGMKGYCIYFGIIEMLREHSGYKMPCNPKTIAFDLREDEQVVENIMFNFGLFIIEENGKTFYSDSLLKRMQHLDFTRVKRSKYGSKGGKASAQAKAQAKLKQNSTSKVNESKVNQKHPPTPQWGDFEALWNKYPKKDGRKASERAFNSSVKSEKDWADINTALENYVKSDTVLKCYIKNGSTWFNNWRDWIEKTEVKQYASASDRAIAAIKGK